MKGLLLTSAIVAVFVAVVITMRIMVTATQTRAAAGSRTPERRAAA